MKTNIIIDSTVDVTESCAERMYIIPLTVHFGSEEYIDGVTIDKHNFYEKLVESDILPTTSQAIPADFQKVFDEISSAGESAVVITISSTLSGTCQSACIAAENYENIHVVDSCSASTGAGILAEYALRCADEGMDAKELA